MSPSIADLSDPAQVAMLAQAAAYEWIGAVVGWVPLYAHKLAEQALERYMADPHFRGVRHLNHEEADPDWLARPEVIDGLGILEERGPEGLYCSSLFSFEQPFLDHLNPGMELGRSFVSPDYQKSLGSLLGLWKGLATFVSRNPRYAKLFGPVKPAFGR